MRAVPGATPLALGGSLDFVPGWLTPGEADGLLADLRAAVPWTQGAIRLFGREVLEPRLTAWFGDADYTYSGRTVHARPWSPSLADLRSRVQRSAGALFNAVLLNLYRHGNDSMGLHSDDEPELGPAPIIASVSLGVERTFVLVPKKKSAREEGRYEVALGHGSLLVMGAGTQQHYRHGIPKQPARAGERLNLTFRLVRPGAEGPLAGSTG